MSGRKQLARSSLTEWLENERSAITAGSGTGVPQAMGGHPDGQKKMTAKKPKETIRSSRSGWTPSAYASPGYDVGSEIQQILSRDSPTDRSSVFGCSPPIRACNPLSRDCKFRRCVIIEQADNSFVPNTLPSVKDGMDIYSFAFPKV